MGKDREGKFHPTKGKPSGTGKENSVELHLTDPNALENYLELADKYTAGDEEHPVKMRHPNRNVEKGIDRQVDRNEAANRRSAKSKNETFADSRTDTLQIELPPILTKEIFSDLANYTADTCISVYLKTHAAGMEVNEKVDSIAFKNVLQNLTSSLRDRGLDQTAIQNILEPGYELLRRDSLWYNMGPGLAVFMAKGYFKFIRMPVSPETEVMVNESFYLKPLVHLMASKEYFYLLVISKKQAKVFRADAFGMQPLPIDELPNGVDDVVRFEEKDDQKLFRTESGSAGAGANFHGQGGGRTEHKHNIAIYLEEVDETLWEELLHSEKAPLLLAGVEYLIPIFKSVTHYKHVWPEAIIGSHEHDDAHALYQLARKKMQPYFEERTKKALQMYGDHIATDLTSSAPSDVIPAAYYGRVWHLFVQKNEHIWGKFLEMENDLKIHENKEEGDECLLDKAVIKTILTGGDVHFMEKEEMPADSKIAALMRY